MDRPRIVRTFTLLAVTSLQGVLACGGSVEPTGSSPAVTTDSVGPSSTPALIRPVGAPCAFANQCASGACSADVPGGGCGVCLDVRGLGERCDRPLLTCSRSAVCSDGICRSTKATAGQPCTIGPKRESSDCDDEL
ncbi:MAG TPA: hypothetical protein VLT33_48400, partial [Labilithrix sp.]|nr:hypothetical protein [Labilithrix sp.]